MVTFNKSNTATFSFFSKNFFTKVMLSLYRAVKSPEGSRSLKLPDFSGQSAHEDGKVVTLRHRPPLPPGKYSSDSHPLHCQSTPRPQLH